MDCEILCLMLLWWCFILIWSGVRVNFVAANLNSLISLILDLLLTGLLIYIH